jgi:eukaryotic-like serine/threonine-protein kinase
MSAWRPSCRHDQHSSEVLEALTAAGVRSRPTVEAAKLAAPRTTPIAALRRPIVAVPLAAVLAAALVGLSWWALQARERTHARAELIKLEEMVAERDLIGAWLLARKLEPVLGEDRELERLRQASTWPVSFRSEPPGAEIAFRGYLDDPDVWYPIGTTPIDAIRLPAQAPLFRAAAPGHVVVEGLPPASGSATSRVFTFTLWPAEDAGEDLLRIPGGDVQLPGFMFDDPAAVELPPFWLGRHEVTNREFQAFVDAGGYRDPAPWREPFERAGRTLEWEEAIGDFVDATGRPGPSTWRLGAFPRRAGRPSGHRRELVRGGGIRPLGGGRAADAAPLVPRRRARRQFLGDPAAGEIRR